MSKTGGGGGDEEDEDECFYESLDRLVTSSSNSCTTSSSSDSEPDNPNQNPDSPNYDFRVPKFPMGVSTKYDVWISEPVSVSERRSRLLREMGLSHDRALARAKPGSEVEDSGMANGDFGRSASTDQLTKQDQVCCSSSSNVRDGGVSVTIVRSKSDGAKSSSGCDRDGSSRHRHQLSVCSPSILSIHCSLDSPRVNNGNCNDNDSDNVSYNVDQNQSVVARKSPSGNSNNGSSPVSSAALSNKPPTGRNCKRVDESRGDSMSFNGNGNYIGNSGEVVEDFDGNGTAGVDEQVCLIKNLDNGKEFVVNEIQEDGTWKKVKEVGTGRQLTIEEFEMCVGHSPIVQELMRRQNVEEGNKDSFDLNNNGSSGGGMKSKKKGSWFKSIRTVASTVTGHKERRSSDERDTSSEKGGRRSSSATDDSQDVSFHGPERVRVRQYGKSCKDLTALCKIQEIQAHNGSIWSIKFSLDGRYLASAGEDCVIHVWQVVESERKGELLEKQEDGHLNMLLLANGSPEPTSLSPKHLDNHLEKKRRGRSINRKSLSLDHIVVPETVFALSEKPICSFQGHLHDVLDLSWSKSQHLLSSSMDKTVRLWHLSSKTCLKIFSHSDYVTCIQFNPVDDRYFISGSLDAKVRIWSIPERQVVDWNDLHEMVTAACYTPDGQGALVGSYKGSCHLYNTSENKLQQKSPINLQNKKKRSHQKKITGFQFAPGSSSEVLITSADSRIRVVDGIDLVHKFKVSGQNILKKESLNIKLMALQAAALVPSAFSVPKEGKTSASFKDSSLFGVSFSEHAKADFGFSALRCKREFSQRNGVVRAQTMATASPAVNVSSPQGKKTLRKGSVIITGASSGLGLATAKALAETGKWHIIMACRDFLKAERAAKSAGMAKENYTIMHLDLASLDSVRQFVDTFKRSGRPLDVLVCNAAVYLPTAKEPTFTAEGFELSVGTNHLGHFLLSRLLLDDLKQSDYPSKRLIIVGSITGNTNTLAGNVPPKANLGDLRGLAGGLNGLNSSSMIDGGDFDGAKAYKDSKVCNMLTMQEFHRQFHEETGITFASLYPGCIATTGLFREHIPLFRLLFPPFQKYITKGYVSEDEAGKRLAQVVSDPSLTKSGVYWSWNKDSASFENQLSQEASDVEKARKVWEISEKLVGLA